jgi:hypothetical protein
MSILPHVCVLLIGVALVSGHLEEGPEGVVQ